MPVSREIAAWGMRMVLGLEPPDNATVDFHRNGYDSLEALRTSFLQTPQARMLFERATGVIQGTPPAKRYMISPFLLRKPSSPDVPWHFTEPDLECPTSQICTSEQMESEEYRILAGRLGFDPTPRHRKYWEFAFILAALEAKGMLVPGRRGLGFGTGKEPLPSVFAKAGVEVLATDAPGTFDSNEMWANSGQWSHCPEDLWHSNVVDRCSFDRHVRFQPVDMNHIPGSLRDFDFCWSACCFEHLGSIRDGLDFLHRSLDTLRPGGVSVQTTEFNLGSNDQTLEAPELVLFRKRDLELVIEELTKLGHSVAPLNLWPGTSPVDEHVDLPPFGLPHLKLEIQGFQITSIGLIITKKG